MESVAAGRISSTMTKPDGSDPRVFVIIGGGAAGNTCAETLRRNGFKGRVVLVSGEDRLPYNRVALSKNIKADADSLGLRKQDYYDEYGIEVLTGTQATSIDDQSKTITTSTGIINYDKLCVATGAKARILGTYVEAFNNYDNVFSIRNANDQTLAKAKITEAQDIVIIGGSFLGLEAATSIKQNWPDKNVTVIEFLEHPLRHVFGEAIASTLVDA